MTIHWKAFEQYFTVVLFVFQFSLVCDFGKFINFGLNIVRSERVKGSNFRDFENCSRNRLEGDRLTLNAPIGISVKFLFVISTPSQSETS